MDFEIIYIHPNCGIYFDSIIPQGLPGLINSLKAKTLGRYWYELKDEELAKAKIFLLELHWHTALYSFFKIAHRLKRLFPEKPIIAGGYTATVYAEYLVKNGIIDYVIKGDAEIPLPLLIDQLLNGNKIDNIPNVICKENFAPPRYTLTREDFNKQNYRSIEFFPSAWEEVKYQQKCSDRLDFPLTIFPFINVFRGCQLDCPICYGSRTIHKRLTGRGFVYRDAEFVEDELYHFDKAPEIYNVSILNDVLSHLPYDYLARVFGKYYNLRVVSVIESKVDLKLVDLLINSFKGGVINVDLERFAQISGGISDKGYWTELDKLVKKRGSFRIIYFVNTRTLGMRAKELIETLGYSFKENYLALSDSWIDEHPEVREDGTANGDKIEYFTANSRKYNLKRSRVVNHLWNTFIRFKILVKWQRKLANYLTTLTIVKNNSGF